jgi:hypothetical protein
MNSVKDISFPKNEWEVIKARLNEGKTVYTIRVSDECRKYLQGDILTTEWGTKVKVLSIKKITGGISELKKEYQYFDQLTPEMVEEIKPFKEIEIVSLKIE